MKKLTKAILLAALLCTTTLPAWSQASTEGKEFWLAATIVCEPPSASAPAVPYIAISAKDACVVTITDYQGVSVVKQHGTSTILNQIPLGAGSWTEFGNTNGIVQLYDIDPSKWYPATNITNAGDVYKHADEKNRFGLHVTSDKNISVFVILRAKNSMDASNILPVSAIQSEYYTQDFWPYAKDVSTNVTMATILAIEDNTIVDITPNGDTYGKSNSGQTFDVTLNKGETYYLMSKSGEQLAGTHINARNGKKIAVYNGCPLTTVPVMVTARDGMYEQSMPIDYWGTKFIVSRSKNKDGNIVGITAANDKTEIYIDGYYRTTIEHAGDTYYCMLQSTYNPNSKKPGDKPLNASDVFTADVAYIYTTCPCAVYSYDTGNAFVYSKDDNENLGSGDDRLGDPSSVWISPIQQTIKEITFGTCYTDKTTMHYLNVVTETATCQQTTLAYRDGSNMTDCSNLLEWNVVEGNTTYSYARALISNGEPSKNVFTLKNPSGFIAHIYGNGDDESYAYSAGSAAVEQGVNVEGVIFTEGYRSEEKFCLSDTLDFDARVGGTDDVTRVDWDFGDGTTQVNGSAQTKHKYTSPGWFDVTATLYGHQVCTDESEQYLGSVSFTMRVYRPDTIPGKIKHSCIKADSTLIDEDGTKRKLSAAEVQELLSGGKNDTVQENCYDDMVINYVTYGIETIENKPTITGNDKAVGYNGKDYYASEEVEDTLMNEYGCYLYRRYSVKVVTCLNMSVENKPEEQHICPGEKLKVTYSKKKGDIDGDAVFQIDGYLDDQTLILSNTNIENGTIDLPTDIIRTPGVYKARLLVNDLHCEKTETFPIDFTVNYPTDIFKYKFNNVLAVYKPGYGGNRIDTLAAEGDPTNGYEFVSYQWYRNGEKIDSLSNPTAVTSVYHTDSAFTVGDEYYVELEDKNGNKLPSCPQTINEVRPFGQTQTQAPAQKMILNDRIAIRLEDRIYNIYGQRVK